MLSLWRKISGLFLFCEKGLLYSVEVKLRQKVPEISKTYQKTCIQQKQSPEVFSVKRCP